MRLLTDDQLALVIEAVRSCWAEIEAMQDTYDDYVASGRLEEQVEAVLELLCDDRQH